MTASYPWHDHHFINRNPALDLANMVVWRGQPGRHEDRGQSLENLKGWAVYSGLAMPASEPCLLLTRRTWTRTLPVTFVRCLHPATRYRLGSRFRADGNPSFG